MNRFPGRIFIYIFSFSFLCFAFRLSSKGEVIPKHYVAKTAVSEIKIDGKADDEAWKAAFVADSFAQLDPTEGAAITQRTEVKVLYNNTAIYVLARMYDTDVDSILHELGNRDEGSNLNSDAFRLGLDPYNNRMNGYVFEVSASGVQSEWLDDDATFDAVWESAVSIDGEGWTAEIKIPYSAIRFPSAPEQHWGIQFARFIRRNREYDQWTLTPKNLQNRMLYWGTLDGMQNIDPPLRLSLTPYLSFYTERAPIVNDEGHTAYENSYSYYGGADIKYGIDERFTLDMTLLPDFSQVQSDNKVKNLTAYETVYDERRPFFKEGTTLFSKGNLLYTRRIGRTPTLFYDVPDQLMEGESLEDNPDKAKLINATKVSGRTDRGLGIGLLNAVTGNTYATIREAGGGKRKVLTEPLSNYNLIIFDQHLKNNSDVFIVNTNVAREGSARDANVTTAQGRYENKGHRFQLTGNYSVSHIYEWQGEENLAKKNDRKGEEYNVYADKIGGHSTYGIGYGMRDKDYDKNDFGYSSQSDYSQVTSYYSYNEYNPFWKNFKQGSINFYANRYGRHSLNNQLSNFETGLSVFLLWKSNWSFYGDFGATPVVGRDFYEPRIEGAYYNTPMSYYGSLNFTTDYNKKLAFDFGGRFRLHPSIDNTNIGYYIIPRIRFNDHFTVSMSNYLDVYDSQQGFAFTNDANDSSFFGQRNVITVENTLNSRYIFKNDMSLSLIARHYWSKGIYDSYFSLLPNGDLTPHTVTDIHAYDFNSNYLTVDLVYNWQFAPGSSFLITYKNIINSESQDDDSYFQNLTNTFSDRQNNSISLKFLYYLDYQYLTRKSF